MSKKGLKVSKQQIVATIGVVSLLVVAAGIGVLAQFLLRQGQANQLPAAPPVPPKTKEITELGLHNKPEEAKKKIDEYLADSSTTNDEKFDLYLMQGSSLGSKGDYAAAIESYKKAEAIKVNFDIVTALGTSYETLGDKAKAIEYYKKTIELLEQSSPTYESDKARYELMINRLQGGN